MYFVKLWIFYFLQGPLETLVPQSSFCLFSFVFHSHWDIIYIWKCLSRVWLFATLWTIQSMEFSRPEYWSEWPFPSPGDLPNQGIKSRSPALLVDSFPAEPQGKPKNTGMGSLSLLQQIFLTQESNQCLLRCRWILYQLSYQGSPWPCWRCLNLDVPHQSWGFSGYSMTSEHGSPR